MYGNSVRRIPCTALVQGGLIALAYWGTGKLGLLLAIPPGYATAIWPPAGIAFAATLVGRTRVWPWIVLGSFLVNVGTTFEATTWHALLTSLALPLSLGMGAALQAQVGALLVRRAVGFPLTLEQAREITTFLLLGGPISCLISATWGVTSLLVGGVIPWTSALFTWWTWWVGDTIGVLVVTPLLLVWLTASHQRWRRRQLAVAVPLGLTLVLVVAFFVYARASEQRRLQLQFAQRASTLAEAFTASIAAYVDALHAIESFYASTPQVDRQAFHTFVQRFFVHHPGLQALSWNRRILEAERDAYEEAMRHESVPDFQITEQSASGQLRRAAPRPEYVVVSYIEPFEGNTSAMGYDVASRLDRLEALQRARDTGAPQATGQLRLVQELGQQWGILIFLPVYGQGLAHDTVEARRTSLRGYVTGVFRLGDMVEASLRAFPREGLRLWLYDETPAGRGLLYHSHWSAQGDREPAGSAAEPELATGLHWDTTCEVAGRRWALRLAPTFGYLTAQQTWYAWTVLASGVLFAGLLGAFLLVLTGHTLSMERLVAEQTATNATLAHEITERSEMEAALRASEAYYRLLFDANPHPMWVYELDTLRILAVNEAAVHAYGYSRDAFVAMTIKDLRPPEDIPALLANLARLPTGYDRTDMWRHRKKDGTVIDVEVSSNAIQFDGRSARLVLAQDVTARLRTEAALRDSEARKGALLESTIEGIITIDQDGKIIEFNPAAERLLGYSRTAVLGQSMANLIIPPALRERHLRGLAHYLATGEGPILNQRLEVVALRADGTEVPIELSITRVGVEGPALFTGFLRDITERKQAEARVQQQLSRLALLHQITRAIDEHQDLHSIFLVVLRHLEQDLPLAFACLCLGTPGSDTVTVTAVGPASQAFAPGVGLVEQAVLTLDQMGLCVCVAGHTASVHDTSQAAAPFLQRLAQAGLRSLTAMPLLVEDSLFGLLLAARCEPQGFSSGEGEFLRQLSEHVALAAHHASMYARLQQAYDDLHQTQQVVLQQERLRALGQMASGIAHDINNAISPITLYVEALLASDATLSARAREYLTTVQQAANDVAHTVARLREFYRQPDAWQEAQPVDLNQVVLQGVELTRAKWRDEPQRRGVTITVHTTLQEDLPAILGIDSELREALTNLIFNAVDAMPHGGTLTLQTQATPTAVVLAVLDTGIGMDEETRQRCLEPFYTTKEARGTGLGLAMVYGIAERHAAQFVIDSALGQGTTVRLLFPVAPIQDDIDVPPAAIAVHPQPLRLLVVDDDALLRRLLQDVLQTEGHVVTVVDGGRAGLEALQVARERQEPFDVVITDLGMPEMDGGEVARRVKQATPDTPVVLLTGWGQALQQDNALPPHVDYLLSKPPRLQALRAALRAVTRPAARRTVYGHH